MTLARLLALALALSPLMAQAAEPDPLSDAREHYERGMSHYQLGEFTQAIDEFKVAYEASRAPGLLFNLAQASRLAKLYEQAVHFYRAYLRARPDAPNRADAEARILELEPLVEAQRQRELNPPPTPPTSEPQVVPPPAQPPIVPPPIVIAPSRPRGGKRERIAGYATGGVGLVALALGIYFGTQALDAQTQLGKVATTGASWDATAQSQYSAGHNDAIAATTLYVVGGAAVAAGAALVVLGWRRDLRARRFAVTPLPGGAQASFSCAF
jgi:tetratricopeptide (TPR) repeat protein